VARGSLGTAKAAVSDEATLASIDAQIEAGQRVSARETIDQLLRSGQRDAELLMRHAKLLRLEGQPQIALQVCDEALADAIDPSAVHWEASCAHVALNDYPSAIDALNVAVALNASHGSAWLRLGEILLRLDQPIAGTEALDNACQHLTDPALRARAHYVRGQCLHVQGHPEQALVDYDLSLALQRNQTDALVASGNARLQLDDEPGALRDFEQALASTNAPSRQLLSNLAIARQNTGDLAGARQLLQQLLAVQPGDYQTRWYLCQLDLLECRWQPGWANYHARFGAGASPFRAMPFPAWDGRPRPDGTLLILADQGIGDEIMFASCFDDAIERSADTLIECEPRLIRLFQRSFPRAQFIATQRQTTIDWLAGLPKPDWQISSGDLPALFRNGDETFPQRDHYLHADASRRAHWRERLATLGPGLKIGLSWRGGTDRTRTRARSIAPEHWAQILSVPNAQFVNLQYGAYEQELAELRRLRAGSIHDFPEAIADYDETAALVSELDLVVTVCTAIVHLSGALGTPVWILSPRVPSWRYTAHAHAMPWYPKTTVYRQQAWGNWDSACQKLSSDLVLLTKTVGHPPPSA
jgi:tetratricopeptide (TPR) repeat protein